MQRRKSGYRSIILVVLVMLLSFYMLPSTVAQAEDTEENGYLTFTSEKVFTITPNGLYANLEYATGDAPTGAAAWETAIKGK